MRSDFAAGVLSVSLRAFAAWVRTRKMRFVIVSVPLKQLCADDSSGDACPAELNSKP